MTPPGSLTGYLLRVLVLAAVLPTVVIIYRRLLTGEQAGVPAAIRKLSKTMSDETSGQVTVAGSQIDYILVKAEGSSGRSVLLLHGARFNLKHWKDINTIATIAGWGVDVAAVTLHGYGGYGNVQSKEANAGFLAELVTKLGLVRPVIVSPSASGSLSLPFLFGNSGEAADSAGLRVSGFVPVAPVATQEYPADVYKRLKIPVCNVYGEKDPMAPAVKGLLANVEGVQDEPIADAGHACYLNNPAEWHRILRKFLSEKVHWSLAGNQ